jgi:hypothetical protein
MLRDLSVLGPLHGVTRGEMALEVPRKASRTYVPGSLDFLAQVLPVSVAGTLGGQGPTLLFRGSGSSGTGTPLLSGPWSPYLWQWEPDPPWTKAQGAPPCAWFPLCLLGWTSDQEAESEKTRVAGPQPVTQ